MKRLSRRHSVASPELRVESRTFRASAQEIARASVVHLSVLLSTLNTQLSAAFRLSLAPVIGVAALLVGPGCNPGKKEPPIPKVNAAVDTGAASPSASAASGSLPALPKLGPAPAWKLTDLNGKTISSDELKGKVVVVDFWATWCAPCLLEIPGYIEMQRKYAKDGLTIVGISVDLAGPEVVKAFADRHSINYPIVMADDAVAQAFGGVEGIPTTFLIDRTGQIRDRKIGAEHSETYEQKVLAVLRQG